MCHMTLMQHFHLETLFDLTLTLTFAYLKPILLCYLLHPLGSLMAEFGFAAVCSPVSVTIRQKVMILTADLTLI